MRLTQDCETQKAEVQRPPWGKFSRGNATWYPWPPPSRREFVGDIVSHWKEGCGT